jgi:hypothetical protein
VSTAGRAIAWFTRARGPGHTSPAPLPVDRQG